MAYLETINGPAARDLYELTSPTCVLGRHPDCDILLDIGAVSRHHAQIVTVGREFFLEDMKSRNGTFLNDEQISGRQRLSDGDQVRVCDISFRFHAGQTASETDRRQSDFAPAVLVDDAALSNSSTIMSKLGVSSAYGEVRPGGNAELRLGALLEITQNLGKALALDEVLPQVLNSLFRIFGQADRGFIALKADGDGDLAPRWTKVRRHAGNETIRISRTIVDRVIATSEAILSADAASDQRFEMSQSIADVRIRSVMCAPLIDVDGKAFGVLQIDTRDQGNRFQQADLEVLVSVASQAAIAIDNAQLHENALKQRALERDLELAHEVQRGFLPERPPKVEGYRFFDFYQPANQIGGDYYDYIQLPDGRVAVVVADVVGHGIAAALLMVKLSAEMRFCLASQSQPAAALTRLNAAFSRDKPDDRFVTLVMTVVDPKTNEVAIVNAGHMPPVLRQGEGRVQEKGQEQVGLPLGIDADFDYQQCEITLSPGDLLVLYTDGINEAMDSQGQFYGIDRVHRQIAAAADDAEQVGRHIVDDARSFIGDLPHSDDMCLVCFGRT